MEVQERSTRHRSLGIDSNSQSAPLKAQRPLLGERHHSAPQGSRTPSNQNQSRTTIQSPRRNIVAQAVDEEPSSPPINSDHPAINLVVFGHPRVGKTSFIRNALAFDNPISAAVLSSRISFEGTEYRVRLCETRLDDIKVTDPHTLKWPKPVGGDLLPSVDGALCLYDLTNDKSVNSLSKILYALSKSGVPVILVACKADAPLSEQEIGITFIERVRRSFPLTQFAESSAVRPESARKCLDIVLKATLAASRSQADQTDASDEDSRSDLTNMKTSDFIQPLTLALHSQTLISEKDDLHRRTQSASFLGNSEPEFPHPQGEATMFEVEEPGVVIEKTTDVYASSEDESTDTCDPSEHVESPAIKESPSDGYEGVSFSDLVDRLLRAPATKNESKFVPAFLCLYRVFATPKRLLVEIIDRFVLTEQSDLASSTKTTDLSRCLRVLAEWTANYPGDFAASSTRRYAISFAQGLERDEHFAPVAKEVIGNLLTIIMDDDRDWAFADHEDDSKLDSRRTTQSSLLADKKESSQLAESDNSDTDKDAKRRSLRNSGSASTTSSIMRSSVTSSQSATNLFNLDSAREQSKLFKSSPHIPLSKLQWHLFMGTPIEELAREITRMDWTMYSAIRTRDFVRHVSLSSTKRARSKNADTIAMMVKHFNHLALFVSGMILLRDKPKHRAKILEKFMDLAWKVRQLNNYNSLGAIVAGITGPEISRLKHTYDLVPSDVQKQFLRLTVLMSISRSYAAYRMAWENSSSERIPFVPLVRQDLTMAASANQTFIGKNINWKKFEIMGDVIVAVQRSHEQPYSFPEKTVRSQEITRLILETKVIEESEDCADPRCELYERSVQLESYSGTDGRKSVANFGMKRSVTGWFQT